MITTRSTPKVCGTRSGHSLVESTESMVASVKRVHWFRSSALCQRWREEFKLLTEEMRRTVRFFGFFRKAWTARAEAHDILEERASAAYARK